MLETGIVPALKLAEKDPLPPMVAFVEVPLMVTLTASPEGGHAEPAQIVPDKVIVAAPYVIFCEGVNPVNVGAPLPVPLSDVVCALLFTPLELSVTVKVPLRAPMTVGVKVTAIVQLELTGSGLVQVLVSAKSPLAAMLSMVRAAVPVLDRVAFIAALVVFRS